VAFICVRSAQSHNKPYRPLSLKASQNPPNHVVMVFTAFLVTYILGGLTFLPLIVCLVILHAYLTFPERSDPSSPNDLHDPNDDAHSIRSSIVLAEVEEKFRRHHEGDVASGYFAVCREYVPGGVNGKPPERTTPAGTVVANESPSVYQSMYRSLFDRRQGPTLDPGKGNGKTVKRPRNVFFVVLRHGHLMLYDDSEQLDPRHVIFLEHHEVGIYGGEETIPEGELFIKRNSIRLTRKANIEEAGSTSKPFYFFSENCSEKEDFYFALLQNQEARSDAPDGPPRPQRYDVKHIITLVQKLHSSEEQLQTRWINGLIGRLFLALYKTEQIEDFIRKKITKKIARVKKPAFLSGIVLRKVDMGEGAPCITNPKLKDLTVDGDCCAEADFRYSGNFRLEIAATARIDLGTRFKAREVNLILAVVVKKLEGHALIKFKPPPSNRVWISFETMPDMDMTIEPIVSSRQITYNIILRAIESRIREVFAETLVLPHWDDSPFIDTSHQRYRGGIWAKSADTYHQTHTDVPDEAIEDEAEADSTAINLAPAPSPKSKDESTTSLSSLPDSLDSGLKKRKGAGASTSLADGSSDKSTTAATQKAPKFIRTRSFASAADPLVSMDHANISEPSTKTGTNQRKYSDATSAMIAISHRSPPVSPTETPFGALPDQEPNRIPTSKTNSISSNSSKANSITERTTASTGPSSLPPTPTSTDSHSINSSSTPHSHRPPSTRSSSTTHSLHPPSLPPSTRAPPTSFEKRYSTASLGAATAAAKKWGWGVLSRTAELKPPNNPLSNPDRPGTPDHPIGRGRPLPPPGQPLPFPDRKSSQMALPKRKPVAPPLMPQPRRDEIKARSKEPPPLPKRRRKDEVGVVEEDEDEDGHGMLVVEAPVGSEPGSPIREGRGGFLEGGLGTTGEKIGGKTDNEGKTAGYVAPAVEEDLEDEKTPTKAAT